MYAAQQTYYNIHFKGKKENSWKESIFGKKEKYEKSIGAFEESYIKGPKNELILKICKREGIWSNEKNKLNIVKNKYTERLKAEERKLQLEEKRRKYTKENALFEWNRKRYYRRLAQKEGQSVINVQDSDIRNFCNNVYNVQIENTWKETL
ncbi:hypothetical protein ENBRE01_2808 [Enteropsectra breve]|nr:hypothetical protein ENBRE01_2808 [Enteropsectra breve]